MPTEPMSLEEIRNRRDEILQIASARGISSVRVFGSVVTGAAHSGSDIDLLVTVEPGTSLVDLAGFKLDLEKLLGCSVDASVERALLPRLRQEVLDTAEEL